MLLGHFKPLLQTVERRQEVKEREVQQRSLAGLKPETLQFMIDILTLQPQEQTGIFL